MRQTILVYIDLDSLEAKKIAGEVASATSLWQKEALKLKVPKKAIERMASAFEHADLIKASKWH